MPVNVFLQLGGYTPLNTHKSWNHVNALGAGAVIIADMVDETGAATGFSYEYSPSGPTQQSTSGINSVGSGDAVWVDEDGISQTFHYKQAGTGQADTRIAGLDDSKTYDFEVYSSWNSSSGNRRTEISVDNFATVADIVEAQGNTTNVARVAGVSPSSGVITLSWRPFTGDSHAHCNAIWLQENDDVAGQSISSPTEITSEESFEVDNALQSEVFFGISDAGSIGSLQAFENDNILTILVQELISSGIESAEAFEIDHLLNASDIQLLTPNEIFSEESFQNDMQIEDVFLEISPIGVESEENVSASLTVGELVIDNPGDFILAGTATDINGAIHAVNVVRTFGGNPTDVFIRGTRHTRNGAMYVTFDTPGAGDRFLNGLLHTPTGIRYVVDSAGQNRWPEGFSSTVEGKEATTTIIGGFFIRGISRDIDGRMVVDF